MYETWQRRRWRVELDVSPRAEVPLRVSTKRRERQSWREWSQSDTFLAEMTGHASWIG